MTLYECIYYAYIYAYICVSFSSFYPFYLLHSSCYTLHMGTVYIDGFIVGAIHIHLFSTMSCNSKITNKQHGLLLSMLDNKRHCSIAVDLNLTWRDYVGPSLAGPF